MKKRKSIISTLIFAIALLGVTGVRAEEKNDYFTNQVGATISKEQFNKLNKFFDEDTLNSMTQESLDLLKNEENLKMTEVTKYIKTDNYYDRDGKLLKTTETEITEEEALNPKLNFELVPYNWNITHTTASKQLNMRVVGSDSVKSTTIKNTWLTIPKIKSYDVIALRPVSGQLVFSGQSLTGYQKWDGKMIYYNDKGNNHKIVKTGSPGVAFAVDIEDNVKSSLEIQMNLTAVSNYNPYSVYGAYEHATSNVSLNEALNFNFSYYGLGDCLLWNNNIGNKYDGMAGVYLKYNLGEEYGV